MKTTHVNQDVSVMSQVARGVIREIAKDGSLIVDGSKGDRVYTCDCLDSVSAGSKSLRVGDSVLFVLPESAEVRGCVIGQIGKYTSPQLDNTVEAMSFTDESNDSKLIKRARNIEIIAEETLVLRCGEGSLSITPDGTVIIKGARILSRSKGVNKIKGASVQIN